MASSRCDVNFVYVLEMHRPGFDPVLNVDTLDASVFQNEAQREFCFIPSE